MSTQLLTTGVVRRLIPRRPTNSYKGKNGHLLVIAGSRGMTGAAYLCALGALKAGAGLVTVACDPSVQKVIATKLPEAMYLRFSLGAVRAYVRRRTITTVAIGPGLSVGTKIGRAVKAILDLGLPTVLDADGLNNVKPKDLMKKPLILTPHPGELSKLIAVPGTTIEKNRVRITQETAARLGVTCVLKGHKTIVSDGWRVAINTTGNPAMATGGMGDVLTGITAAFLAQGLTMYDAACAAVYVHGSAGDIAKRSDRGLLATELALSVPAALRKLGLR